MEYDLDLGDGHYLKFCSWAPDRALNPQYAHLADNDKIGGIISHTLPDGSLCEGSIWFDCRVVRQVFGNHPRWQVDTSNGWNRLTCTPSFLCHCGDHGYIQDGKWVRA